MNKKINVILKFNLTRCLYWCLMATKKMMNTISRWRRGANPPLSSSLHLHCQWLHFVIPCLVLHPPPNDWLTHLVQTKPWSWSMSKRSHLSAVAWHNSIATWNDIQDKSLICLLDNSHISVTIVNTHSDSHSKYFVSKNGGRQYAQPWVMLNKMGRTCWG